jgi:hypothetical protein
MKPTVLYSKLIFCEAGQPALVCPVNHPDTERVSNEKITRTSLVQQYDEGTGSFETENTRYVRATPQQLAALGRAH